jgi:hypothetical protein
MLPASKARGIQMRLMRFAATVACTALLAGCGGAGADAPRDASIDDFCATKEWFVAEGLDRFRGGDFPPSADALAELAQDWAREFARVGTPENMSADARVGFEKFLDRLHDIDGGEVPSGNWEDGDWENEEEKRFAQFVNNTCP